MKKAKKMLALLIAAAMAFSLIACGSSDDSAGAAEEETEAAEGAVEETEEAEPAEEEESEAAEEAEEGVTETEEAEDSEAAEEGEVEAAAEGPEGELSQSYSFSVSSASAVGTTVNRIMERMVEAADEEGNGNMNLTHYAAGQLGGDSDVLAEVLAGNVDIMTSSTSTLGGTIPQLELFDLYCAMTNEDTMQKLFADEEFREEMDGWFESVGLKLLLWDPVTMKNMVSTEPIESIDDFNGYNIRVMDSDTQVAFWTAIGANPTVISSSETYLSIQTGMVSGLENGLSTILGNQYQEVTDYCIETRFVNHMNITIMNLDAYNSMTQEDQAWFDAFCDQINEEWAAMATEDQDAAWDTMTEEYGLTRIDFNQELFDAARDVAEEIEWPMIREELGDDLVDLYLDKIAEIEG